MHLRCDQAIGELAASADTQLSPTLAAHLASCPDCASWAEDGARLLRDWHSVRAVEPTAEVWDALWSRVCAQLDAASVSPARPDVLVMPERLSRRHRLGLIVLGLAQAAAILAAVVLLPGEQPRQWGENQSLVAVVEQTGFDVPSGQVAIIHSENNGSLRMELREGDDGPGLGSGLAMFNVLESIADTE
jgi:hypothetical protein